MPAIPECVHACVVHLFSAQIANIYSGYRAKHATFVDIRENKTKNIITPTRNNSSTKHVRQLHTAFGRLQTTSESLDCKNLCQF